MKKHRGVGVEGATNREILRKQLEILAENSIEATDSELCDYSIAMCEINKTLVSTRRFRIAIGSLVGLNAIVGFFVFIKKFFSGGACT